MSGYHAPVAARDVTYSRSSNPHRRRPDDPTEPRAHRQTHRACARRAHAPPSSSLIPEAAQTGVQHPRHVPARSRVSCSVSYSFFKTKHEPRMVPASLDFCPANLNFEASSAGTSIPTERSRADHQETSRQSRSARASIPRTPCTSAATAMDCQGSHRLPVTRTIRSDRPERR